MIGMTVCSGIGSPEVACPEIEWRAASEIEPFPRAVLCQKLGYRPIEEGPSNHGGTLYGDFTQITAARLKADRVPLPEILVAGTPCQAFSLSGKRKGTDDARGNLTLKFVELVHDLRSNGPLRCVVWENVPGVLSDDTNAFGCFISGIIGADHPMCTPDGGSWPVVGMASGPRARLCWRVLNAEFFGLAQRRKRLFVVVDLGDGPDPASVLFERQSLHRHSAPRRKEEPVEQVISIPEGGAGSGPERVTVAGHHGQIAGCVSSKWAKGTGGPSGNETQNLVAFSCTDNGADVGEVSPTLRAMKHDKSHPNSGGQVAIAIQERATSENPEAGPQGAGIAEDVAYTIEARRTPQAVAFKPSFFTRDKDGAPSDVFPPLTADADKGDQDPVIFDSRQFVVRRITPREAERLQGFPDDHTLIEWPKARRKEGDIEDDRRYLLESGYSPEDVAVLTRTPDGPRYCAIGNAMPTHVMDWILKRCLKGMDDAPL